MSVVSKTTVGGGTFEELVRGKKTYVAQVECLVELKNKTIFEDIQRAIISHCEQTLSRIESESLSTIEKFYIGKAFIKQRRKPGGRGFIKFDHMDTNTWKKNGIGSRWATHKKEEYGRDGLIVLTAISRDCVLQTNPHKKLHQEQFTLALEQTLIHHYRFKPNETRLENNSFNTGGVGSVKAVAYCIYVAFRLSHDVPLNEQIENQPLDSDQQEQGPRIQTPASSLGFSYESDNEYQAEHQDLKEQISTEHFSNSIPTRFPPNTQQYQHNNTVSSLIVQNVMNKMVKECYAEHFSASRSSDQINHSVLVASTRDTLLGKRSHLEEQEKKTSKKRKG